MALDTIEDKIRYCISNRIRCTIYYRNEDDKRNYGWGLIEPYTLGITKKGNLAVRAWQLWKASKTKNSRAWEDDLRGIPGWRVYLIKNLSAVNVLDERVNPQGANDVQSFEYEAKNLRSQRRYNPKEDGTMGKAGTGVNTTFDRVIMSIDTSTGTQAESIQELIKGLIVEELHKLRKENYN